VSLIVGIKGVLLLIVGGIVSWFRVARERDLATLAEAETRGALERADAALHDALVVQAAGALDNMDWPTADRLVARAFTLDDSTHARGVALLVGAVAADRIFDRFRQADAARGGGATARETGRPVYLDDCVGGCVGFGGRVECRSG
jgi:hypothetical protein